MKWTHGNHSSRDMYVMEDGTVTFDSRHCTCSSIEGYGHEPYCGLDLMGFIDSSDYVDPGNDIDFLWSSFWDFTQV